jgi:uncharacterized protein (TIGR04552 family)
MNSDPPPPSTRRTLERQAEAIPGLRPLSEFNLHDVDAVRLVLRGGSVIDWHRLNLTTTEQAGDFIRNHELDPGEPADVQYITTVKEQAISYLRRNFALAFPKPVQHASAQELLMMASGTGHRQQVACTVLKAMQIINHTNGRELLFRLPVSDRDLFHLVEEKVYRVVGTMLSEGFPITEFVGGRKNLDSTYTKLLSKPESSAVALYDKLRFRIVTRQREDLLPILLYLSEQMFPFNYVVPNQSTNTMFHFRSFCESHPQLKQYVSEFQGPAEDALTPGDNRFSSPAYRTIQFVADVPVRVPPQIMDLAPQGSEGLGPIVYMLCEIQLLDAETEEANETGTANHEAYKQRQKEAVHRRIRLGARAPQDPNARKRPT